MAQEPARKVHVNGGMEWLGDAGHDGDRTLWLFIKEPISMLTIAAVFGDEEKTKKITYTIGNSVTGEWEGYTEIYAIRRRTDETDIGMRRPEPESGVLGMLGDEYTEPESAEET